MEDKGFRRKVRELADRAWATFQDRDYELAITAFKELAEFGKATPYEAQALRGIGLCYSWLGQRDKAIASYQEAVERFPECDPCTYVYLGLSYIRKGQWDSAAECFQKVLAERRDELRGDFLPMALLGYAQSVRHGRFDAKSWDAFRAQSRKAYDAFVDVVKTCPGTDQAGQAEAYLCKCRRAHYGRHGSNN